MLINYFQTPPLDITELELDEYEKYLGKKLCNEDKEAILKSTGFRKVLTIRRKLKVKSINNFFLNDLESYEENQIR
ncbi:hypothetical protein LEP1GSC060_3595 [Leptospira weilii serovar Ranarum str. ICFT]|uniref:Uncharacterized protein n=1 Tax=Leptospira weilii serovar Ranarum str. ICFT TaxID=1218598 RepID=N1WJV5_9LEPT|nr:hypothetical protein [Leptospira weilii]EMY79230.1 hypothetical protein LEP1GSC060_3595 [Leptospira weilii serovar Ranarum str. ICFT]